MKTGVVLGLMLVIASGSEIEDAFAGYMSTYGKSYGTTEEYTIRLE